MWGVQDIFKDALGQIAGRGPLEKASLMTQTVEGQPMRKRDQKLLHVLFCMSGKYDSYIYAQNMPLVLSFKPVHQSNVQLLYFSF